MKYEDLIELHGIMKEKGVKEILAGQLKHLIAKRTGNADPLSYSRTIRAMEEFDLIRPEQYGEKRKVLVYKVVQ